MNETFVQRVEHAKAFQRDSETPGETGSNKPPNNMSNQVHYVSVTPRDRNLSRLDQYGQQDAK